MVEVFAKKKARKIHLEAYGVHEKRNAHAQQGCLLYLAWYATLFY